jgi:hypothetical protein
MAVQRPCQFSRFTIGHNSVGTTIAWIANRHTVMGSEHSARCSVENSTSVAYFFGRKDRADLTLDQPMRLGSHANDRHRTVPDARNGKGGAVTQPSTHYARSGDVRIAYQVVGNGPIDLVFVPGFVSNLDIHWEDPGYGHLLRRLGAFTRLILLDKRGTGLSDRVDTCALPARRQRPPSHSNARKRMHPASGGASISSRRTA